MPPNIAHKIGNRSKMPSSNNASISGLVILEGAWLGRTKIAPNLDRCLPGFRESPMSVRSRATQPPASRANEQAESIVIFRQGPRGFSEQSRRQIWKGNMALRPTRIFEETAALVDDEVNNQIERPLLPLPAVRPGSSGPGITRNARISAISQGISSLDRRLWPWVFSAIQKTSMQSVRFGGWIILHGARWATRASCAEAARDFSRQPASRGYELISTTICSGWACLPATAYPVGAREQARCVLAPMGRQEVSTHGAGLGVST